MTSQQTEPTYCAMCRGELGQGMDVHSLTRGVIGPRGFITLEEPLLFCSDDCLSAYYNGADKEDSRCP
jgi:hypothetical protein